MLTIYMYNKLHIILYCKYIQCNYSIIKNCTNAINT